MKDSILQFLSAEKISPAEFADKIGVQRSSMSHILNGRNYPSASFIQKMLIAYPLINSRWLMIGEGKMNTVPEKENLRPPAVPDNKNMPEPATGSEKQMNNIQNADNKNFADSSPLEQESNVISNDRPDSSISELTNAPGEKNVPDDVVTGTDSMKSKSDLNQSSQPLPPVIFNHEEKEIEQILFFYKDKTFSLYRPS